MARIIVITSGKGGVGKTTLTANLGRALGALNKRVLMIDTDMGLNNLDVILNIEQKVVFDIVDVLKNRCRLSQALIEESNGVFVLPSNKSYESADLSVDAIKKLAEMTAGFDFCLIDCPAGIEMGFHRAVSAAEEAIIVATPHISSLKDADKVISILRTYSIKPRLVLNRVRGDLIVSSDMVSPNDVKDIIRAPLIGVIPENDEVSINSNTGKPLGKLNEAAKATMMLAKNLVYDTDSLYDAMKGYRGILGRLKRGVKRHV